MVIYAYSLPAIFAFITKVFLLVYSSRSPLRDVRTRLFVIAVVVSMFMNVIEITGLQGYWGGSIVYAGYVYNGALAGLFAVLAHLAIWVAFEYPPVALRKWLPLSLYGCLLLLWILLACTDLLITGFEWLGEYTITRIPGPLYPLFEFFAACTLLTILVLPIRGLRQGDDGRLRSRCQIWMIAAVPSCLLLIAVLTLLRLDVKLFNATVTMPIPMALLLVAVGYCVHNNRIIDLTSYVPFTKAKRSKRGLYASLRAAVTDAAGTESVKQLLDRLSAALECPVHLIGPAGVARFAPSTAAGLVHLPLADIRQITVVHEVGEPLKESMKKHRIGAIMPLFPTSETARSWLLFGESFGARIYTPTDFQTIDHVIKQLAGRLLDALLQQVGMPPVLRAEQGTERASEPAGGKVIGQQSSSQHLLAQRLDRYEAYLISEALKFCDGNQAQAARLLGIQPSTLHYKLKRLKLPG